MLESAYANNLVTRLPFRVATKKAKVAAESGQAQEQGLKDGQGLEEDEPCAE